MGKRNLKQMRRSDGFTQIVELTPGLRTAIEGAIEALISLLDAIDGDADLVLDEVTEAGNSS